jgi:signal transduction histidine kinase
MRFAASAAHELKTPLATLRLYGDMLAEGLGDTTRSRSYAARIAAEAGRLARVVINILDLSRLERGVPLVNPRRGDLAATVRSCVEGLVPSLEEAGMEVALSLDADLAEVDHDPDAVCQIVTNLLDNAERYTRGGEPRRVEVSVVRHGGGVRLLVVDNGPGINEATRRTLFRPFARGSAGGDPSGLGLGLALGRSLARAHGGDLQLMPTETGRGAAFAFTLPGQA